MDMPHPGENREQGSVLIMALLFVTVAGLVIGALVNLAGVDLRNTIGTRDQRSTVYAADAAVHTAINSYRQTSGATCPGAAPSVNGVSVTVTCSSPLPSGSGGASSNLPPLAIITRPSTGETGITVGSGSSTHVAGGVYSNTDIKATSGTSLDVTGKVTARTGCFGTVTATDTIDCTKTGAYADGNDPAYTPLTATLTAAPMPSCASATNGVLTMPIGTYADAGLLNSKFTSCPGVNIFYFPPAGANAGVYYFEFTNAGSHQLIVPNGVTVVGGTLPNGLTPSTLRANLGSYPAGSRCDATQPGVQFIFGGDSTMFVNNGSVDLCAQPSATAQQIAVYGLPAPTYPAPLAPPASTNLPDVVPGPGGASSAITDFSPADSGRVEDGTPATATVASTDSAAKRITLNNFNVSGIPAGSTINSVTLDVKHQDTIAPVSPSATNYNDLTVTATVTGTGASYTCSSTCLSEVDANHSNLIDLSSQFTTPAQLQNLSVDYSAKASKHGSGINAKDTTFTESIDGAILKVNYTPPAPAPALHAENGCATKAPYSATDATTCALIVTSGSTASLSIQGTVYAPTAAFDIQLTNAAYDVIGRGIIARSLRIIITPALTCLSLPGGCPPPFQLPSSTPAPTSNAVVFEATVGTNKRLRALVSFPTDGSAPTISSWSVVNE